jgi:hypothetical protein
MEPVTRDEGGTQLFAVFQAFPRMRRNEFADRAGADALTRRLAKPASRRAALGAGLGVPAPGPPHQLVSLVACTASCAAAILSWNAQARRSSSATPPKALRKAASVPSQNGWR